MGGISTRDGPPSGSQYRAYTRIELAAERQGYAAPVSDSAVSAILTIP